MDWNNVNVVIQLTSSKLGLIFAVRACVCVCVLSILLFCSLRSRIVCTLHKVSVMKDGLFSVARIMSLIARECMHRFKIKFMLIFTGCICQTCACKSMFSCVCSVVYGESVCGMRAVAHLEKVFCVGKAAVFMR